MSKLVRLTAFVLVLTHQPLLAQKGAEARQAEQIVDRAIVRMGGDSLLRAITAIRRDVMTQWQRTTFGTHPYADQPSYERHQDLRSYTLQAWRNTRAFIPSTATAVDIVADTIGYRVLVAPGRPENILPLNVAYVDERRELFAFAAEKILLHARDRGELRTLPDTMIDGHKHRRVGAQVAGFATTLFFREADHLPVMARFRANEVNDFGLAPWGEMEIEMWYSAWAVVRPGALLPRQVDVRRAGRPYKRMTAMTIVINPPAPADSFAIPDSIVQRFLATERRPMWAVPLDATKGADGNFAAFPPQLGATGAVLIGGKWIMLETGQAAGAMPLVQSWFAKQPSPSSIGGGLVTMTSTSNGGVSWFVEQGLPLWIAPGAEQMVRTIAKPRTQSQITVIRAPRWVKIGTDSLWMEPINAPDMVGALAIYSPTHRWVFSSAAFVAPWATVERDQFVAKLRARGWPVNWIGSGREIRTALP